MGLSIHFSLRADVSPEQARSLIERLNARARGLGFQQVSRVVECHGSNEAEEEAEIDAAGGWMMVQATRYLVPQRDGTYRPLVDDDEEDGGKESDDEIERDEMGVEVINAGKYLEVEPIHLIGFHCLPGEGSESLNVALCRYPATIEREAKGRTQVVEARLGSGFSWMSACKTQYASNPESGGIDNFLAAHGRIVSLFDSAKELGILRSVHDESGFWADRDVERLTATIHRWNAMIAGFVGNLNNYLEKRGKARGEAPITDYPNFEHLEAEGMRQFGKKDENKE